MMQLADVRFFRDKNVKRERSTSPQVMPMEKTWQTHLSRSCLSACYSEEKEDKGGQIEDGIECKEKLG